MLYWLDDIFWFPYVFTITIYRKNSIQSVQHVFIFGKAFSDYNVTLLSPTKILSPANIVWLIKTIIWPLSPWLKVELFWFFCYHWRQSVTHCSMNYPGKTMFQSILFTKILYPVTNRLRSIQSNAHFFFFLPFTKVMLLWCIFFKNHIFQAKWYNQYTYFSSYSNIIAMVDQTVQLFDPDCNVRYCKYIHKSHHRK